MSKCFAGTALYRSWMVYHHGHILRIKQHTSKLQAETDLNIQLERKQLWQQKAKNALSQLTQKMELEHKRPRPRSFVSIIVLKISVFSYLHFFTFCYLSWATLCDVASSDYYESILFNFMSVLAHSKFPQNWQSFWYNDVGR